MGINIKYGGEAVMQWKGKGNKRNYVGLGQEGREGVRKRREEDWNGRERLRKGIIV